MIVFGVKLNATTTGPKSIHRPSGRPGGSDATDGSVKQTSSWDAVLECLDTEIEAAEDQEEQGDAEATATKNATVAVKAAILDQLGDSWQDRHGRYPDVQAETRE